MWLVCALATSDLLDRNKPLNDPSQPWPVNLAAALYDDAGEKHQHINLRIRAAGRQIAPGAVEAHGISAREAERCGVIEAVALVALVGLAADAEAVVGFGMPHIRDTITGALMRAGRPTTRWLRAGLQHIDLIPPAAAFCKLPGEREDGQYLWPNLITAARAIVGATENRRDTWSRMELAARIFFRLKIDNLIELGPLPPGGSIAGGVAQGAPTPQEAPPANQVDAA